ncbi:MAG: hypothetical protein OXI76_12955, partial [Gemmatimonadota bacterium]|nr:hypothetical protein [Gemmatimonadota bacterium]
ARPVWPPSFLLAYCQVITVLAQLEHQAEEAHKEERRSETRAATKTGVAAGIAMVAARALMGTLDDGDDE